VNAVDVVTNGSPVTNASWSILSMSWLLGDTSFVVARIFKQNSKVKFQNQKLRWLHGIFFFKRHYTWIYSLCWQSTIGKWLTLYAYLMWEFCSLILAKMYICY
jgi:hypothetical protein